MVAFNYCLVVTKPKDLNTTFLIVSIKMAERKVSNLYRIFKLKEDELNWTYIADGPVLQHQFAHCPVCFRDRERIPDFTDHLIREHMEYLGSNGYHPQNRHCSNISFSYKPPYVTSLVFDGIWHTEELSREEIQQFERCVLDSHKKYWNRHQV